MKIFITHCALLSILLSGCSRTETPVAQATQAGILLRGNSVEPEDLDPHIITGISEYNIILGLFEGLVTYDPQDLHPIPGAAEHWEVSEDGLQYTFHLRPNGQWSNGDPLTAQDFLFSFERILSPVMGSEYASMLYPVKGASAFHKGTLSDFDQVGFTVIDEHTLQVTLEAPTPYFLSLVAHWAWYPVHPKTIQQHGSMTQRGTGWTRPENFVGNGPFTLKSWTMGESLQIAKNPLYWNAENVRLNEVHFFPISEVNTEERAFRAGQLHLTEALPRDKVSAYKAKQSPYLSRTPALSTYCYAFNTQKAPFNDARVRTAFNLVLAREALTNNLGGTPAYAFTPPNLAGYTCSAQVTEDIQKAQDLLAQAGYPQGQGFPAVTLLYNTSENHRAVAEAVQEMWRKHLGVNVQLENQEWKVFLNSRRAKQFDIVRGNWIGDYPDPSTFLEVYTSTSSNNHSQWSNSQFDALISQASHTLDKTQRNTLFDQAETILLKELPLIPIHFSNNTNLVHTDVHGWHPNILNVHPYQYVYLDANSS